MDSPADASAPGPIPGPIAGPISGPDLGPIGGSGPESGSLAGGGTAGDDDPVGPRRSTVLVVAAAVCLLLGAAVIVAGPVRWSHDRSDAARQREATATLATCLRFQSLASGVSDGSLAPTEVARRVGELNAGATEARADVRAAVADLQREVMATSSTTGRAALGPAADAVRAACATP